MSASSGPSQTAFPPVPKLATRLAPVAWWVREVAAVCTWLFVVAKLFVYDVDRAFFRAVAPQQEWLLDYRAFILLGTIATLWLVLQNQRFLRFVGYVIGYPLVILFYKIPRLFINNWAVAIAFSPAIYSVIKTLRWNFIAGTAGVMAALAIQISSSKYVIGTAACYLALYLVLHFIRRFRTAFQSSTVFATVAKSIRKIYSDAQATPIALPTSKVDSNSADSAQARNQDLLMLYVVVSVLHYLSARVREVAASRKLDIYFLASLLCTFALTAITFAFLYQATEHLIPGSFGGRGALSFWNFLAFSFSTLMTSELSAISPNGTLALLLSQIELIGSLILIVLLVFVILTSIRERYKDDINQVEEELGNATKRIEARIEKNHQLSIGATEVVLVKVNPVFVKWAMNLWGREVPPEIADAENVKSKKTDTSSPN